MKRLTPLFTLLLLSGTISYANTDLTIGYVVPELSEVRNAESFSGGYIKGGYRFDSGYGVVMEYHDLTLPDLDDYHYFVGGSKKIKAWSGDVELKAVTNHVRYKIGVESFYHVWYKLGIHGGFSHSQKYAKHGKLTDVVFGGYYMIDKFNVGVDYSVGNASGDKGSGIQDRADVFISFSD